SRVFDKRALQDLLAWRMSREHVKKIPAKEYDAEEERILQNIRTIAQRRFSHLFYELRTDALRVMERMIQSNPDKQIPFMPLYLRRAFGMRGDIWSDEDIARLGFANILFWSSTIVYDDFWDEDEKAEPRALPTANLFARYYADFFCNRVPGTGFRRFFHRTMD